jgi:hypothetical protein
MDPETREMAPPGARPAPPEVGASAHPTRKRPRPYRRAAGQRCWVCNAPDSEPVRLQRRLGERWVADTTLKLCTACLTALRTPRLVRQLGLGHWTTAPSIPTAGPTPARPATTDADAPGEAAPPLTLLKGA